MLLVSLSKASRTGSRRVHDDSKRLCRMISDSLLHLNRTTKSLVFHTTTLRFFGIGYFDEPQGQKASHFLPAFLFFSSLTSSFIQAVSFFFVFFFFLFFYQDVSTSDMSLSTMKIKDYSSFNNKNLPLYC